MKPRFGLSAPALGRALVYAELDFMSFSRLRVSQALALRLHNRYVIH